MSNQADYPAGSRPIPGDDLVREQQENYPDEPFKPWPLGDAEVQMMVSPKVREKIVAMLLDREQTAFRAGQAAMQFRAAEECRILSLPLPPAPREDDFVRDFAHRASQNILALPLLESSDPRTFTELREQRIVQEQQKQAASLAVEATVNAEAGGGPRLYVERETEHGRAVFVVWEMGASGGSHMVAKCPSLKHAEMLAAAPDMLEALRRIADEMQSAASIGLPVNAAWLERRIAVARAILDKVEGGKS